MKIYIILKPKYEYNIPPKQIVKQGTYEEALLFYDYFGKDYYNDDPTRIYTGDNYSLSIIKNELAENDIHILLIRDSFSRVVAPFLASTCKEIHIIDLRTFDESVTEYINKNDIDICIVLYNPSTMVRSDFYEFD